MKYVLVDRRGGYTDLVSTKIEDAVVEALNRAPEGDYAIYSEEDKSFEVVYRQPQLPRPRGGLLPQRMHGPTYRKNNRKRADRYDRFRQV